MKTGFIISKDVEIIIPKYQLLVTKKAIHDYIKELEHLELQLKKCPKIGETDGMEEHPLIFHYFTGSTDFFICEYDRNDTMYGYAILGGDLQNAEWCYFSLSELTAIAPLNIEYI